MVLEVMMMMRVLSGRWLEVLACGCVPRLDEGKGARMTGMSEWCGREMHSHAARERKRIQATEPHNDDDEMIRGDASGCISHDGCAGQGKVELYDSDVCD